MGLDEVVKVASVYMKGSSEIEPCSCNISRMVLIENEPIKGTRRRSWRSTMKTRVCDFWKQSKEGFQDQLYEMLMGQVKSSCKLTSGLNTVEVIGDFAKNSFWGRTVD